jgi:pimeloyl-ACP methyl ester carboxylesterase
MTEPRQVWSRRRLLASGAVALVGAAVAGVELVDHGVLPGKHDLEELTGGCSAPNPDLTYATSGPSRSGRFDSRYRGREVGYTIAYPPGHGPGSDLPLVLSLHGNGGSHTSGLAGVPLGQALAARHRGRALAPMALVSVDGGDLYWNPHPGDDPMGMIVHELIPMCQRLGLGRGEHRVGAIGVSMGGYGVLLLAEKHPELLTAVAAISPAVWTTYGQARAVNPQAFASRADFINDDVITHAFALKDVPVRVASGDHDPFHPGVLALIDVLPPANAVVQLTGGCHDGTFFASQRQPSLEFLADHLAAV